MPVYTPTAVAQFRDQAATVQGSTSATGPAANASLTTVTIPNAGLWEVAVYVFLSGTVTAADAANMVLKQNSVVKISNLPVVQAAASGAAPVLVVLSANTGDTVNVSVGAGTPGASCGYNACVIARQVG